MMFRRVILAAVLVSGCVLSPGCGSKEKETRERERLELEEKARRDAEAANKAITEMNQRMFRKKPADDPGAPPASGNATPQEKKQDSQPSAGTSPAP